MDIGIEEELLRRKLGNKSKSINTPFRLVEVFNFKILMGYFFFWYLVSIRGKIG